MCKNGGTCVIDFDGDVKCNCSNEFQGAHCEIGKIQSFLMNWFFVRLKESSLDMRFNQDLMVKICCR